MRKPGFVSCPTFRHTYSTLLHAYGTDMKVQQELLRHSDIRTTDSVGEGALPFAHPFP
jgi:integrase